MTIRIILYEAQITYDFSSIEFVLMNHIELISPFGHLNLLKIFSQAQIAFSQCIAIAIGLGLHIEMIVSPFSLLAVACLSENLATIKSYPLGLTYHCEPTLAYHCESRPCVSTYEMNVHRLSMRMYMNINRLPRVFNKAVVFIDRLENICCTK